MPSDRALLVASLLTEPPDGVPPLRVTISIASVANSGTRAVEQLAKRSFGTEKCTCSAWNFRAELKVARWLISLFRCGSSLHFPPEFAATLWVAERLVV